MSYQKYDEIRKERDQLRAELEESRKSGEWAAREMSGLRQRNDALIANIIATRADNEALRVRLGEATRVIGLWAAVGCWKEPMRLADCGGCGPCQSKAFLASGSSMGEARCPDKNEDGTCMNDWCACDHKPAAPEPAPAPTCDRLIGSLSAPCTKQRNHGGDHEHDARKAPASAQGTTEPRDIEPASWVRLLAKAEALDKRVAALEEMVRKLDGDVALLMPQHAGLTPFERAADFEQTQQEASQELTADGVDVPKFLDRVLRTVGMNGGGGGSGIGAPLSDLDKAAPPQPAPVERHAYAEPSAGYGECCAAIRAGKGTYVRCGQPRSAAVHGEGGK